MGNEGLAQTVGFVDVCLETSNGTRLMLRDVRHALDMCLNLISASELDDEGYCNTFSERKWKLTKSSLVVARENKYSNLYMMHASIPNGVVNVAENESSIELWHRRLSHVSEKGLNCLARKKLLPGTTSGMLKRCVHCLPGKQNRVSFHKHPPLKKADVLELVHSDVCGPLKVRSLGGALYFVTFIDDYSRKVWVYTLKTKDQVLDVFKQFHALIERQTWKTLKCILTDNGGEYRGQFE